VAKDLDHMRMDYQMPPSAPIMNTGKGKGEACRLTAIRRFEAKRKGISEAQRGEE